MDKESLQWLQIEKFLEIHDYIKNADIRKPVDVSAATASRILADFAAEGKLEKYRINGYRVYKLFA